MLGWRFFSVAVLVSVVVIPSTAISADGYRGAPDIPADAQSRDEFRAQVPAIVQAYREGGITRGHQLTEQFRLPHAQDWFSEHLGSEQSAEFANRYDHLYANFEDSFEHTVEAIVAIHDAEFVTSLDIGDGETPKDNLRPGAKLSGTVSTKPVSLLFGQFKITVKSKSNTFATGWGYTYVHQDGAFRFLGFGGWLFWVWQSGTEGAAPKGGVSARQRP